MNHQTVNIPCKYCNNKLVVSRYANEELNVDSGICDDCKYKIKNAQECNTCHIKLFQGCAQSECKYYKFGDRLYHVGTEGWHDYHLCKYHYDEHIRRIEIIAGVYDD